MNSVERMTFFLGLLTVQLDKNKKVKCMDDKHLRLKNVKMRHNINCLICESINFRIYFVDFAVIKVIRFNFGI